MIEKKPAEVTHEDPKDLRPISTATWNGDEVAADIQRWEDEGGSL